MASKCPLCRNAKEDLDHPLIHCPTVWGMWVADLLSILGFQWACPYLVKEEVLSGWCRSPIKQRAKNLWLVAPLSLIWAIEKRVIELFLRMWLFLQIG